MEATKFDINLFLRRSWIGVQSAMSRSVSRPAADA